jgi:hypothetical protein
VYGYARSTTRQHTSSVHLDKGQEHETIRHYDPEALQKQKGMLVQRHEAESDTLPEAVTVENLMQCAALVVEGQA